jgi:adenylate kinase
MDRQERFDFQHNVEDFLENKGVYELFESLLKDLVAKRPKEPLDFLIDRLQKPQCKS